MYDLITVNAGHSKLSPGASGNGYQEHAVARGIKDKLLTALKSVGQKCVDTTSDGGTSTLVLKEQKDKCNSYPKKGRLDVSIHLNAGGGTGTEVLYYSERDLSAKVSKGISNALGIRDRGAKERKELYFLNGTNAPAILIEICFIDSADDMVRLFSKMDAMIESIVYSLTMKKIVAKTDEKTGLMYRVITGSFENRENANKRVAELKAKGFDSFVEIK